MNKTKYISLFFIILVSTLFYQFVYKDNTDKNFVTYIVNPKIENICFYLKNNKQENFGSILNLKTYLNKKNKQLLFAMNGGMYKKDKSPQGLYIQNKILLTQIDTTSAGGNFYLKPNGVFYISTNNVANVCKTDDFKNLNIKYATQSGPMLVVDGEIHKAFNKNSTNLNIRNGVGILPNNEIVFVMSKKEINFYDFAEFFKNKGCKNALYLDGLVSRTYCPKENWEQIDGDFGVIIGVTKK
ncbi:phosphodiester glycosidase family protein [Flavobacterium sp.]|uniref:phosphodiester glycosidase family protein n=1 Tax=Flavobacterium sp. TaxID=239 RepID=UPI0037523525